ncbi:MAG: hypothetical protein IKF07_06300 [Eubacterium sp.]|nr:hypothetical protein [Eubacterium sp.]
MIIIAAGISSISAFGESDTPKAKRTIMLYCCGSDLETRAAMATYNLRQILKSRFSSDDDIRFIIMTGGSTTWHLDDNDPQNDNGLLVFKVTFKIIIR